MARARIRSWLFLVAVLALATVRPAAGISPSFLMVYGGSLKEPAIIRLQPAASSAFVWDSAFRRAPLEPGGKQPIRDLATSLTGRSFVSIAIFWGQAYKPGLEPADASQHGRMYLPTASLPAVMVATLPDMQPVPHPVPDRLEGFVAGWTLTPQDHASATALGIPGFN
ncbi:MAG TPA: hypothetical protein VF424_00530 [Vicinamibacterales bacterium]